jgi:hypothetical protein
MRPLSIWNSLQSCLGKPPKNGTMIGNEQSINRRPKQVVAAFFLGMISQGVILLSLLLTLPISLQQCLSALPGSSATHVWWLVIGIDIAMVALYLFLLAMFYRCRKWARIMYIVLVFIFAPLEIPSAFESAQSRYVAGLVSLLVNMAGLVAVVLLMQKQVVVWFKRTK